MEITYMEQKTEIISVETLIRLAKRIRQLGNANVVINMGWDGEVLMDDEAFMEMFPVGWEESEPLQSAADNKPFVIRSISVDGITFKSFRHTESEDN